MDNVGDTEFDVAKAAEYIYKHFGNSQEVQKAMLEGSLGKYGVCYKLTIQIIGSWIYKSQDKEVKNRNPMDNLTF